MKRNHRTNPVIGRRSSPARRSAPLDGRRRSTVDGRRHQVSRRLSTGPIIALAAPSSAAIARLQRQALPEGRFPMPLRMAEGIELLADPTRRHIVALLAARVWHPSDVAAAIGLSRPAVSRQLSLLAERRARPLASVHDRRSQSRVLHRPGAERADHRVARRRRPQARTTDRSPGLVAADARPSPPPRREGIGGRPRGWAHRMAMLEPEVEVAGDVRDGPTCDGSASCEASADASGVRLAYDGADRIGEGLRRAQSGDRSGEAVRRALTCRLHGAGLSERRRAYPRRREIDPGRRR